MISSSVRILLPRIDGKKAFRVVLGCVIIETEDSRNQDSGDINQPRSEPSSEPATEASVEPSLEPSSNPTDVDETGTEKDTDRCQAANAPTAFYLILIAFLVGRRRF